MCVGFSAFCPRICNAVFTAFMNLYTLAIFNPSVLFPLRTYLPFLHVIASRHAPSFTLFISVHLREPVRYLA